VIFGTTPPLLGVHAEAYRHLYSQVKLAAAARDDSSRRRQLVPGALSFACRVKILFQQRLIVGVPD
jgi:hypothetical protein